MNSIAEKYIRKETLPFIFCPGCGHGTIYDGTFSGKKIPGNGVAAELLEQNGIAVYTDEDCAAALPF